MKPTADISIVIPVYRAKRFVKNCLDTIQNQSILPKEVIFIDDASNDGTTEVIEESTTGYDLNCRLLKLEVNRGPSSARNLGLKQAAGNWIAFLDVDDQWDPKHLESLLETASNTNATFVYSLGKVIDMSTNQVLPSRQAEAGRRIPEDLYRDSFIMPSQVLIHRSLIDKGLLFDEKLRHSEDADYWITLCLGHAVIECSNMVTFYYNKHSQTPSLIGNSIPGSLT